MAKIIGPVPYTISGSISNQNMTEYTQQWRPLIDCLDRSFRAQYSHGFITKQWGQLVQSYSKHPTQYKLVSLECHTQTGTSLEGLMAVQIVSPSEVIILHMESAPWNHHLFGNNRKYRYVGATLIEHAKSFVTPPGKILLDSENDAFFELKMKMTPIRIIAPIPGSTRVMKTYELKVH